MLHRGGGHGATARVFGVLAIALFCNTGCSDGGKGGPTLETRPLIALDPPGERQQFLQGAVPLGGELRMTLRVTNAGNRDLRVAGVRLAYEAPHAETVPALRLEPAAVVAGISADEPYVVRHPESVDSGADALELQVVYTRNDDVTRSAILIVTSDNERPDGRTVAEELVRFDTLPGSPHVEVPQRLDFQRVPRDPNPVCVPLCQCVEGVDDCCEGRAATVVVSNTGSTQLEVTGFQMLGNEHFALVDDLGGHTWRLCGPDGDLLQDGIDIDPPYVIQPSGSHSFVVRYVPEDATPADGRLRIFTNDLERPRPVGAEVLLTANTTIAALEVEPERVSFGGVILGTSQPRPVTLRSVGSEDLRITSLALAPRTMCGGSDLTASGDFTLDLSTLPHEPTAQNPLVLPMNEALEVQLTYTPDMENPRDAFGMQIPDTATLRVEADNTFEPASETCVDGVGVTQTCPIAVIHVREGEEVIPQTFLHLEGDQSFSQNAPPITAWQWEVEQPEGSQSTFVPSATFPNPTFQVNAAGEYRFRLHVWDSRNVRSCEPAEAVVVVIPDEAIHVELLWRTPGDAVEGDEGPEAGADLDLHFAHAFAAGQDRDGDGEPDGWFDQPFDCFWYNPHPNWGSFDPALDDDPGLDRDDTDGAGPENINLNIPENSFDIGRRCGGYRVGVHSWDDHGFGPSYATLRVYIWSELVFELSDIELLPRDFWDACCIDWPSGQVDLVTGEGGSYRITSAYPVPFFGEGF